MATVGNAQAAAAQRSQAEGLKREIEMRFPALWPVVEAALAAILAMVAKDVVNPPTLHLVGPASSAKTTVLDMLCGHDGITYRSDKFTPKALVTHAANVRKSELANIDMLPKIKHKALITPELAPMFRGNEDALTDTFAILTAVLDGHGYISDSGTQGQRGYTGDYLFAWLGATTPLPWPVWKVMAQLGSRLFFYQMPDNSLTADDIATSLAGGSSYRTRLEEAREKVGEFLRLRLDALGGVRGVTWNRTADRGVLTEIAQYARLLAQLRGVVSVAKEYGSDEIASYSPPHVEVPTRAAAVLYNLARGRALLWGRQYVDNSDLPLIKHVVLSSMPTDRALLFRSLLRSDGAVATREAGQALKVALPTARKLMRALELLDVADIEGEEVSGFRLVLRPEWRWCLREAHTGPAEFQPRQGESDPGVCDRRDLDPPDEPDPDDEPEPDDDMGPSPEDEP
jgi:hypothetical protein